MSKRKRRYIREEKQEKFRRKIKGIEKDKILGISIDILTMGSTSSIPLKEDFLKSLRYRIINFLNHPSKIILGKERRSFARCPKDDLPPCVKKRPTFRALFFCFVAKEEDQRQSELASILGLEKRLSTLVSPG